MARINAKLPSRIVNNLACGYAGLKLLESVCMDFALSFGEVFPLEVCQCITHLESAAKNYLLDGSEHNKSVVEETLEIISRMSYGLNDTCRVDGDKLYLWLPQLYDRYTKYRRDFAIEGEVLDLKQFKKQLEHSVYFIAKNEQECIRGVNHKCWVLNYKLLQEKCDVEDFADKV